MMKKHEIFNLDHDQLTLLKQLLFHFYPGIAILIFYALTAPVMIDAGYPGLLALLLSELLILAPLGLFHMYGKSFRINGRLSLKHVVVIRDKLKGKTYLKWSLIGIVACVVVYMPFYPVGLILRETLFSWLPVWYFNPGFGTTDSVLLGQVFLLGIFVDGLLGPIVEELYFRGYLLPRMAYLKKWAPVANGVLFGLYHFWQPHNYPAIIAIGIILSYIVWKKRNVYLGILIHCFLNLGGAIAGYFAATGGGLVAR